MEKRSLKTALIDAEKRRDITSFLVRLLIVAVIDGFVIWFSIEEAKLGNYVTVSIFSIVAILLSGILLFRRGYPFRWMAPGLALLILFSIYPNLLTIYIAFTNYGTGNVLTEIMAIEQLEKQKYLPEEGAAYRWTAYKSADDEYALWLLDSEGVGYLAMVGEPLQQLGPNELIVGDFDENGIPVSLEGFTRLNAILAVTDQNIPDILFGDPEAPVQIRSPQEAAQLKPLYVYDRETGFITSQETGVVYTPIDGVFTSPQGETLSPGYRAFVGFDNFVEFFTSPALRGPLLTIAGWNFLYPTLAVITQFGLGLLIALLYNDPKFPGRKLIRSFLILPYTVPSLITILIWRGMFNQEVGIINKALNTLFGIMPLWTADPWLARFEIVLIALWLGFPYFMLISMGALQSIPEEIYDAATVDGANNWQRFRRITFPLLLVAVGPLLLASYVHNFNNFNLMFLIGGPPILGSPTPANTTDILISYVYRLAFEGGRGQDYGLASAITILIFFIVLALSLIQYRYTNMWEEVSENV